MCMTERDHDLLIRLAERVRQLEADSEQKDNRIKALERERKSFLVGLACILGSAVLGMGIWIWDHRGLP